MPNSDLHIYMDALTEKFGPCFTLWMPWPTVVLTSYDLIYECLVNRSNDFSDIPQFDLQFGLLTPVPNAGILPSNGENWKEQRKVSIKILKELTAGKLLEDKIMHSLESMFHYLNSLDNQNQVDLLLPLQICLGNVISSFLFGYETNFEKSQKFLHFLDIITQFFIQTAEKSITFYSAWPWLKNIPILNSRYKTARGKMNEYYGFIVAEVEAQRRNYNSNTSSSTFVNAYLNEMQTNENKYLDITQLCGIVSDFWLAGMEVTITTTRWAILYLMTYPEVQRKAYAEIGKVVPPNEKVSLRNRPQLPYISALLCEVERYSALGTWINRLCEASQFLHGQNIPADTNYIFNVYSSNQNMASDKFPTNEFHPERFLIENGTQIKKEYVKRLTMFGMGKRRCPAEDIAKAELFLVISNLIQRYEIQSASTKIDTLDYTYGLIMYPTNQLCKLVERHKIVE
ncbi:cytochrome p450 domain-containing protein [Ditylenchus destructor]|nr:cytochrome p450 domain-containing protein [Ditylenchus destructor]